MSINADTPGVGEKREGEESQITGRMEELEESLGKRFMRVHRAYLVNLERILELDLKHREILMENGGKCCLAKNVKRELLDSIHFS